MSNTPDNTPTLPSVTSLPTPADFFNTSLAVAKEYQKSVHAERERKASEAQKLTTLRQEMFHFFLPYFKQFENSVFGMQKATVTASAVTGSINFNNQFYVTILQEGVEVKWGRGESTRYAFDIAKKEVLRMFGDWLKLNLKA